MKIFLLVYMYVLLNGEKRYSSETFRCAEDAAVYIYNQHELKTEYKLYTVELPGKQIEEIKIPTLVFK